MHISSSLAIVIHLHAYTFLLRDSGKGVGHPRVPNRHACHPLRLQPSAYHCQRVRDGRTACRRHRPCILIIGGGGGRHILALVIYSRFIHYSSRFMPSLRAMLLLLNVRLGDARVNNGCAKTFAYEATHIYNQ